MEAAIMQVLQFVGSFCVELGSALDALIEFILYNPIGTVIALIVVGYCIYRLARRSRKKKTGSVESGQRVRKHYTLGVPSEQQSTQERGFNKASNKLKNKAHLAEDSAFTANKEAGNKRAQEGQKGVDKLIALNQQDRVIKQAGKYYAPKRSFCTDAECAFLATLEKACEEKNWKVFPKVQIRELCYQKIPKEDSEEAMLAWNLVKMKHVDFLICDGEYKPLIAVEYDDSTHASDLRTQQSDAFKAAFFAALGIPLVRVPYGFYTSTRLAERLSNAT